MKDFMVDEEHKLGLEPAVLAGLGAEAERPKIHKSASAFRTISEVADDLHVPQHVLRFWESKFPQVRPLKRGGGRRYYRPEDVVLLRRVADLLYTQGYTIKGVQRLLRDNAAPVSLPAVQEEQLPELPTALQMSDLPSEQPAFETEPSWESDLISEEQLKDSVVVAHVELVEDAPVTARDAAEEVVYLRSLLAETLSALENLRLALG